MNEMMEKTFEGSIPAFIAAFAKSEALTEDQIEEIKRIIGK